MISWLEYPAWLKDFFKRVGQPEPHQRPGQWAFNLLHELRSDLADSIRSSGIDPFHDDARLCRFTRWLLLTVEKEELDSEDGRAAG